MPGCSCQPPNTGDSYAACTGSAAVSTDSAATLGMYAASAGASSTGPNAWMYCLAIAFMRVRRFIYYKQNPGDCGSKTSIQIGTVGAIGQGLLAGSVADPEPVSKGILTALGSLANLFGAAHAAAVNTEQSTLCDVAVAYNQNATSIENALASGQITLSQAVQYLDGLVSNLMPHLQSIAKTQGDAAQGYIIALNALMAYNTAVVYPALANPVSGLVTEGAVPTASTPGAGQSVAGITSGTVATLSNPIVLVGLAVLAFILLRGKNAAGASAN
jgi:hypothetical protein